MRDSITEDKNQPSNSSNKKAVYLPGLNGLRAIAALAVVISHITLGLAGFGLDNKLFGTDRDGHGSGLPLAGHGVTIFFTLSGFLITFLLLKEKEVHPIKIKDFYIRRILRIWPLYYLYFLISLATILIYGLPYTSASIPFYIFLAANVPTILDQALPLLTHYWSLGVEEQFYLFFPQLARLNNKKLLKITLVLICALIGLKFGFWLLYKKTGQEIPYVAMGITRFHTMLIGVAGAILYYYKNQKFLQVTTHIITQGMAWGVVLLIGLNKFHIASFINGEIVSVFTVILIMGQITKRNNIINLENKVCDFIGKISYGIYVIHPILIFYFSKLLGNLKDNFANYLFVYLLITTATILMAYLSYEYYEKWFLKLKTRFATVKSASTKDSL
ncbi:MAG: acyltransferase [Chitinophagaceae bacterium]|nr:acyltransferase [Chitinophagaceae bacterium]